MSSRREEKEQRRAARLADERAAQSKRARRQRLLIGGGVLVGVGALAVIVALVTSGGSDKGSDGPTQTPNASVPIPARQITNLEEAARKAGCDFKTFPEEGHLHLEPATATNDAYKTNPPTSGDHRPPPAAADGVYATGNEPDKENWVHTLEHGRIVYQYAPGTPQKRINQLQTLFAEPFRGASGYHQAVMQNNTDMPFAVAAVAWTRYVVCDDFTDDTFDVFRAFRDRFVDKGREFVP